MSSKKGRKYNTWKDQPVKLLMKVLLDEWFRQALSKGLHSKRREKFVLVLFWSWFSGAQRLFKRPLTAASIYGRAFTPSAKTKRRENPNTNPTLRMYVPAAKELMQINADREREGVDPLPLDEVIELCERFKLPLEPSRKPPRREISEETKLKHIRWVRRYFNGMCPCCGQVQLVDGNGEEFWQIRGEFDHFFSNQLPTFGHSWFICLRCHRKITYGVIGRMDVYEKFAAYQNKRKKPNAS